jgi:hypothetical protein
MMNWRRITGAVAVLVVAGVIAWPRGATADKPSSCAACTPCVQWEVMLAPPGHVTLDAKALPQPGKSFVEQAPAGWEPFALTPAGALVYRRCAK